MVIDAVFTWVNGNDENHKDKLRKFVSEEVLNSKDLRTKLDQDNEIEFAVKSILKHAKFVRNIFIVTDNQTPDFLKDIEKAKKEYPTVFIVDHKTIFEGYHQYLPTFNSLSIESLLYKIPNLSEHFLYFNDDFFIANSTKISDFFINGKPVIRGKWKLYRENIWHKRMKSSFQEFVKKKKIVYRHSTGLQKAAKIVDFKKYVFIEHTPVSLRKSTLADFFEKEPKILEENIKYRFRNSKQFVCHSLANHLEIKKDNFVLKNDYQLVYFQNYKKPLLWLKIKLKRAQNDKNKLFVCMQSLDQCPEVKLKYIKNWLHNKYD